MRDRLKDVEWGSDYAGLGRTRNQIPGHFAAWVGLWWIAISFTMTALGPGSPQHQHAFAQSAPKNIVIGLIGPLSGPRREWGSVNRYAAEVTANRINKEGGLLMDGERYPIQIIALDDRNNPISARAAAERLVEEFGVRYIIGPNSDGTVEAIQPVLERNRAVALAYSDEKLFYLPPREETYFATVASYQIHSVMFEYLVKERGITNISFIAPASGKGRERFGEARVAAKENKIEESVRPAFFGPGTIDFTEPTLLALSNGPDCLFISGVAPIELAAIVRLARFRNYGGLIATDTPIHVRTIMRIAPKESEGLIAFGSADQPTIHTDLMRDFIKDFKRHAGRWQPSAAIKLYAAEILFDILSIAGPDALENTDTFRLAASRYRKNNRFLKGKHELRLTGEYLFGARRQLGVPVIINEFSRGKLNVIHIGTPK